MPGRELLRRQPVAAAGHPRHDLPLTVGVRLAEGGDDVEVERLAHRAGLLGAVQHADLPHGRGQRLDQRLRREGPVQPHLDHADLLVPLVERRHRPPRRSPRRAHHDHDPLGLRMPAVLDDVEGAAGALGEAGHQVLDHAGSRA
jgi:hypothetical protein